MKNGSEDKEKTNLRGETRVENLHGASVEFIPGKAAIAYHFRLKNFSSKGFGIMVRKDSKLLTHIKTGDILNMKYYPDKATANPVSHQTQIIHISEPVLGQHAGHMLVGLLVLE